MITWYVYLIEGVETGSFSATAISEGFMYGNAINDALSKRDGLSRLKDAEVTTEFGNLWKNKEAWLDQTTVLVL